MKQGRRDEALAIYRWFRPLLDLDVSTYLVQNIKLAEVHRHRHQRPGAHAAPAAVGRAAQGGGEGHQGRACRAAGTAAVLSVAGKEKQSEESSAASMSGRRPSPRLDIAIIGGGIIGICAAAYLAEAGRKVTVIDRTGICEETSSGNAAALRLFRHSAARPQGHDAERAEMARRSARPADHSARLSAEARALAFPLLARGSRRHSRLASPRKPR